MSAKSLERLRLRMARIEEDPYLRIYGNLQLKVPIYTSEAASIR